MFMWSFSPLKSWNLSQLAGKSPDFQTQPNHIKLVMYILLDPIIIIIIIIIIVIIMIIYIYTLSPSLLEYMDIVPRPICPLDNALWYPRNWSRKGWLAQHETRCRFHRELPFGFIVVPLSSLLLSIWLWVNTSENTFFSGLFTSILSQLFWCEQKGYLWFWHTAIYTI